LLLNSPGARLIAKTVEEVLGRDDYSLFEAESARQLMAEDRRVMESGESITVEHTATAAGVTRTYLSTKAPFLSSLGEVLGVLGISRDITEQKQTDEQLRGYYERVQALSRQLLTTQEQERRHLARELHDEFGQVLAAINFQIHAAKLLGKDAVSRLDLCTTLLQQATDQIRNLAQDLRPMMLDRLGLEAALRWLVDRHWERTRCEVQFTWHLAGARLSPDLAIACYRVVQEALTNVVRHAKARKVWIELRETEGVMELIVRDDGAGFDVLPSERWAAQRGSLGLVGMGERVSALGGRLAIQSAPGRGTRICATVPLTPD
jgi:signal transduction histidine kinase